MKEKWMICINHLMVNAFKNSNLQKSSKELNVEILEKLMENQWTYQIVKVYIRCTDSLDLLRNLILLKVQNNKNSMEKYVH